MTEASPRLSERLLAGERRALARAISWSENGDARFQGLLSEVWDRVGRARRVGVTGPPGAGKSTLVDQMVGQLRAAERSVGVLAIDPSSPFSGGALLGDRIRMEERTGDDGVFIRSMASRGSHGGLSRSAVDALDVMDAFGLEELCVETVGVGQAEYEVVSAADTVLVVLCPGGGDGIQAMKAGILEVADVLVVNKADRPGADRLVLELEDAVHTREVRRDSGWVVPVVSCSAGKGQGVEGVLEAMDAHRAWCAEHGLNQLRARKRSEQVRRVAQALLDSALWERGGWRERVESELASGRTPYDVARAVASQVLGMGSDAGSNEAESGLRSQERAVQP